MADPENNQSNSVETAINTTEAHFKSAAECLISQPLPSCTIVIFGASGDLTSRKLIPALFNLFINRSLPKTFSIVGCSRSEMTHETFRVNMNSACSGLKCSPGDWDRFAENLFYVPVQYDSNESFTNLATFLTDLDRKKDTRGNRMFYLAIPPTLYPGVSQMIGQAGLAIENQSENGWARIVVEKPFGRNLATALELDRILHSNFKEHQIFRIDHYLAKETVQNILMLRFANAIFEPIWKRNYIDYVGIIAAETLGVEHRAGYYEQAGVLRDMFQNHMKQLLALTAMEPPSIFQADRVRDEKAKVFRSLRPFTKGTVRENLILGQYGAGEVDGKKVPAYRAEPGVAKDSTTPTFGLMRLFVDNWRWHGVPFYLASGKRLKAKDTRIVIQFKEVPHSLFRELLGDSIIANRLNLGIYPEEKISLTFQTKSPGARVCLRSVTMDFNYHQNYSGPQLDAYEKVLLDCILGDHMLFWRQDGVELAWSFLEPVLDECEACGGMEDILQNYPSGSWGPDSAHEWMRLILGEC
ncbi:MAG: glucose-6-phosphate dehydrogenase [Proteobacteria bacterium]|nr:glucose-6-phosphate dehydrogenase [Pseudomonadota bacterium]